MTNPFDYVNSINVSRKNMMRGTENDTLAESDYKPWTVNNAFSHFPDTVLHANEMNMYPQLEKRAQYEYLLHAIRPMKRYAKWPKQEKSEELDMVVRFYDCNPLVGKEYLRILTKEQLDYIKSTTVKGGTN